MPENSQTPKNSSSEAVPMNHVNAIVPHKISDHKTLVQTSIFVDGRWVNINDANDQANMKQDLHKVNSVVAEAQKDIVDARNTADSAVKSAESAISASKVNSDAIVAANSSAKEAYAGFNQALASANASINNVANDAKAIQNKVNDVQAQIASDQNINASSVKQLQSDIRSANQNIATANDNLVKAKSAAEESHKVIESSVAAIQATVAQNAKDIQVAQAANSDTAKQLATYTSEAQTQGKTIKQIESDANTTRMTIADIKGNVAQVQTSVTGLQGSLKNTNDNVATVKAQADGLSSTLTDAKKDITNLTATATKLSSSLQDTDGRLSTVEQTASEHSSTISDLKGNLSQLEQSTDSLTATLKDTQNNITRVQATAKGLSEQMSNAQGDITGLQKTAAGIQSTLEDHSKNITALQARAGKLEADMSDAQSNITIAQQTASGASVTASNAAKDAASAVVTASEAKVNASDANSNAAQAVLTASNAGVVAKNAQSDVLTANATASEAKVTATNASSQAAEAALTANSFSARISGVEKTTSEVSSSVTDTVAKANDAINKANRVNDVASNAAKQASQAVSTANSASAKTDSNAQAIADVVTKVTTNTTNITATQKALQAKADQATVNNVKGTLTDLSGQVSVVAGEVKSKADQTTVTNLSNSVSSIKNNTQWKTVSGVLDANNLKTTQRIFYQDTQAKNTPNSGWFYLMVDAPTEDRVTQTLIRDNSTDTWTRVWNGQWSDWAKVANGNDISNLQAQITKNSTSISNNANAINLKADKSVTDALNKVVQQQSAQQTIMANAIKSKITQAQLTDYVNGKGFATETYAQNLVNQTANTWSLNLSELTKKVNDNQSANTTRSTQLQASIDGLQGTVTSFKNDTTSRFDQLDSAFSTKVWKTIDDNSKKQAAIVENNDRVDLNTMTTDGKYLLTGELINSPFSEVSDPASSASSSSAPAQPASPASSASQPNSSAAAASSASASAKMATTPASSAKATSQSASSATNTPASSTSSASSSAASTQPIKHSVPANVILTVSNETEGPNDKRVNQVIYLSGSDQYYTRTQSLNKDHDTGAWAKKWSNWQANKSDESSITQMQNDINFKVSNNGLMSQINLEAGRMLFDSDKIYLNAKSVVFGKDATAFIPSALITDLTADRITTGTLKSININNGDGAFTVDPQGNVVANSIKIRQGYFNQGDIIGANIYAISGSEEYGPLPAIKTLDDVDDSKHNWFKINGDILEWHRVSDEYSSVGPKLGYVKNDIHGNMSTKSTLGLTIADTEGVTLSAGQRAQYNQPDEGLYPEAIKNHWNMAWASETNLEVKPDEVVVNLGNGGSQTKKGSQFTIQKDDKIGFYVGQGNNGNLINVAIGGYGGAFNVNGPFFVHGSKNAVVPTTQGTVAINAYETAEYYFGDIGESQTGDTKKKWVSIDYVFGQTVNTNVPYQVFITPYSSAHVWVSKRLKNRFLVESDQPNAAFAWEIKAKRKGYEDVRLSNVDKIIEEPAGVK